MCMKCRHKAITIGTMTWGTNKAKPWARSLTHELTKEWGSQALIVVTLVLHRWHMERMGMKRANWDEEFWCWQKIKTWWNLNMFWNQWQNIGCIFGAVGVYGCMRHMCHRLKRTAQIAWMEASELLQNRNKCSREGGTGVPHCWLSLSIPMKPLWSFLSLSPPCRVEKVDGCYRCQWAVGEWQMAGGISVILELIL